MLGPGRGGGGGEFKRLPSDDKLVAMFETLAEIGTLYGWVYHIEEQVDYLTSSDKAQNKRLKLFEYKSIDMEGRSRGNNLNAKLSPIVIT